MRQRVVSSGSSDSVPSTSVNNVNPNAQLDRKSQRPQRLRRRSDDDDDAFNLIGFEFYLVFAVCVTFAMVFVFLFLMSDNGQQRRADDTVFDLPISLKTAYTGDTITIPFPGRRQILCTECNGVGGIGRGAVEKCTQCRGRGSEIRKAQIAPGFYQQFKQRCSHCGGAGELNHNPCPLCHGKKVIRSDENIEIVIPKGIPDNHDLVLKGFGHQVPGWDNGHVIVKIRRKNGKQFRRDGVNLYTTLTITMKEALLGFNKEISHLDGHKVRVAPTQIIQPDTVLEFAGEGMPYFDSSYYKGTLYIEFKIRFPNLLTVDQKEAIQSILRGRDKDVQGEDKDEEMLISEVAEENVDDEDDDDEEI